MGAVVTNNSPKLSRKSDLPVMVEAPKQRKFNISTVQVNHSSQNATKLVVKNNTKNSTNTKQSIMDKL